MSTEPDNIAYLPVSAHMTVDQAKAIIARTDWQDILCIGYDDDGDFKVRSSHMSRRDAVWLAHCLIEWARNPE